MTYNELQDLIKSLRKDATTVGILQSTGLNFYFLEPQAKTIYPVFYPLLASIPRTTPMFNGIPVGGDGVHWKAITAIGAGDYPGISEGNRNAFMKFQEKDYFAGFKFLGTDTQVSFQAERMGQGFEDNIGLAQVSMLNQLLNQEERMILFGNSGSAGNGFQLGTTGNVTISAVTTPTGKTNLSNNTYYLACIALTGWGVTLATATALQLPFSRTNADGSVDTINGGTGAYSAISSGQATTSQSIKGVVAAIAGALGYAWFIGTTAAYASLKLVGITGAPTITVTNETYPGGGQQAANASNATGNFTTDNSANALDFDGLITWAVNYSAAAQPSYIKDLGGAALTATGDGTIAEFETVFDFFWTNYKLTFDKIYLGGTTIDRVAKAILAAGTSNATTRLVFETDAAGRLIGGTFPVAYRSKYGPMQVKMIDVSTHPWLPDGTAFFDLMTNPYPAAGNAIPAVRRIMTLEDHFSIKWPYRRLQHEVGVYTFETLQHYIPFGTALLTGIG